MPSPDLRAPRQAQSTDGERCGAEAALSLLNEDSHPAATLLDPPQEIQKVLSYSRSRDGAEEEKSH